MSNIKDEMNNIQKKSLTLNYIKKINKKEKSFFKHITDFECNLPFLLLAIIVDIVYFIFTIYIKENTKILQKSNLLFIFILINWFLLGTSLVLMTMFEYKNLFNHKEKNIHKIWAENTRFIKMILFTIPSTVLLFLISFNFLKVLS